MSRATAEGARGRARAAPRVASGCVYVYVARCADGTLYTGVARDVEARIAAHDRGRGARYTRGRGPLAVHAVQRCDGLGDALRLERAVKKLPRARKERLADPRAFRALAREVVRPEGARGARPERRR